jgi:hypothetical protein
MRTAYNLNGGAKVKHKPCRWTILTVAASWNDKNLLQYVLEYCPDMSTVECRLDSNLLINALAIAIHGSMF